MKKISPTRALTTTALIALAGLAAPAAAQTDAPANAGPTTQQPLGPNGVPVAQQAPQALRTNRPLLKPAMIDLDELAKQPRLKPGMQRRLPGVKTTSGDAVTFVPGVAPLNALPAPAADSVTPGIPGVVPVILPDQPRKRPVGWSVKPEEPEVEPIAVTTEPAVNPTGITAITDAQPASAAPTVVEVSPNFAFPEAVVAAPAAAPAATAEVTSSATPVLGPSRLTAFGSSDVVAALPATEVSLPSEVVGTLPVPANEALATRTPQIEQNSTAFNTPVVTDREFRSNMPVVSDRKAPSLTMASTGLDENGQPLRPAVLPPEVREVTLNSATEPATPAESPSTSETPAVAVTPAITTPPEAQPQPTPVVETPAAQPVVVSTPASAPAEMPASSEPVVVVATAEAPAPASTPATTPTEVPEPAPMPAPLPGLTFRTPAPAEVPTTTVTPTEATAKVVINETPTEPAATIPAPAAAQPEPVKVSVAATEEPKPATPEPTFSNAVSAAAAKLAERAAATAAPETTTAAPSPTSTSEIDAKLAAKREMEAPAATESTTPEAPVTVAATPVSATPAAEIAKTEPASQPSIPSALPSTPEPAVAIATDSGKPVEVLPAPTAGSAQDPFTAKGDGIAIRVAELTGTPGMVQWLRDGGNDWQIPELNEAGNGKYTIRTGPDAGAVVAINETTKLRVGRLSRAEVRAMSADGTGGPRRLVVALTRGRVAVIPAPGTAVNVYTPQSLVVVREPTEVIHDTASGTRTVAYVEKSPASAEVMTTP